MPHLLKELKSFWTFYKRTSSSDRRIVFYAEDIASYSYYEGLIRQLTDKENQKICYITSDLNDPLLIEDRFNLKAFYIKSLLSLFTLTLNSEILIMTMPDLHQFHIRRSEFGTHHIYMFHNIGNSFPVIRYGALFHYDTIFSVGQHHDQEIRHQEELYNLPQKNLIKFGYFRLEKIYRDYRQYISKGVNESDFKANILLGPTWGDDSILNTCGYELIKILLDNKYRVIMRPHPVTLEKSPEVLDGLNANFGHRENYVIANDISKYESIFESDLLISDWSGFVYEYAFGTERPILFIDVPQKIVNKRYKEVKIDPIDVSIRDKIGTVISPYELDKLDAAIGTLLSNKDNFVKEIEKARDQYIYNFGTSSESGAKYIMDYLIKGNSEKNS